MPAMSRASCVLWLVTRQVMIFCVWRASFLASSFRIVVGRPVEVRIRTASWRGIVVGCWAMASLSRVARLGCPLPVVGPPWRTSVRRFRRGS